MSYKRFDLVLMVTHRCNLQCDYCYQPKKPLRSMSREVGWKAIDRALDVLELGGVLDLGFFGGEPLLEAELIGELVDHAYEVAEPKRQIIRPGLTTNGTVGTPAARRLLADRRIDFAVSFDGLPAIHDRHRKWPDGRGSSEHAWATIREFLDAGRHVSVVFVVRPDSVGSLAEAIEWLSGEGVTQIDLTLDVWSAWNRADCRELEDALHAAADRWRARLPLLSVSWLDEKAAHLAGVGLEHSARCSFGDGQIAVSPAGSLYPCERLIGADDDDNPMKLAGHALDSGGFLAYPAPARAVAACGRCAVESFCNTSCRCNNYFRTGDITRPDALLCLQEQVCTREVARVLGSPSQSLAELIQEEPQNG